MAGARSRSALLSKVEISSSPVAGSVFMLQGSGGNIGVSVGADEILIVDDLKAVHAMLVETIGLVCQRIEVR